MNKVFDFIADLIATSEYQRRKGVLDCADLRNDEVKKHGQVLEEKLFFYYDETENFGKLRIDKSKTDGYNRSPRLSTFVLGGIWCKNEITNVMAEELIHAYASKTQAKEVKFKNIFGRKCSFVDIICNSKLELLLGWMEKYDVCFHFTEANALFDLSVALYDSLPGQQNALEKDVFLKLMSTNYKDLSKILDNHKYPFIDDNQSFWNDLLVMLPSIQRFDDRNMDVANMAKYVESVCVDKIRNKIRQASYKGCFVKTISSEEKGVLSDDLCMKYIINVFLFLNSEHYFDNEKVIKNSVDWDNIYIHNKKLSNYRFVNAMEYGDLVSEEIKAVYISDWVVRILQQTLQYLRFNGEDSFFSLLKSFTAEDKSRFIRFCKIIKKSREMNPICFRYYDVAAIQERINWLIDYEITLIKASIS